MITTLFSTSVAAYTIDLIIVGIWCFGIVFLHRHFFAHLHDLGHLLHLQQQVHHASEELIRMVIKALKLMRDYPQMSSEVFDGDAIVTFCCFTRFGRWNVGVVKKYFLDNENLIIFFTFID